MTKIRVLVIFGGQSGEHEVSLASVTSVMSALSPDKYDIIPIGISKTGQWINSPDALKQLTKEAEMHLLSSEYITPSETSERGIVQIPDFSAGKGVDIVLPLIHGPYGEDGRLQ
jgi:D-alanine-D-alanine ligase